MDSSNRIFFVKALYSALELGCLTTFSLAITWNYCVPSKVSFFAWEASWGKVLTLDQL